MFKDHDIVQVPKAHVRPPHTKECCFMGLVGSYLTLTLEDFSLQIRVKTWFIGGKTVAGEGALSLMTRTEWGSHSFYCAVIPAREAGDLAGDRDVTARRHALNGIVRQTRGKIDMGRISYKILPFKSLEQYMGAACHYWIICSELCFSLLSQARTFCHLLLDSTSKEVSGKQVGFVFGESNIFCWEVSESPFFPFVF